MNIKISKKRARKIFQEEIQKFLSENKMTIHATTDINEAYRNSKFIIIATPTNLDESSGNFDVDSVQKVFRGSTGFENAGIYILRGNLDHVFIDCGPIGFGGKGGHGHNDCLSFEAFLDGTSLITDSGSYTYTEDFELRNKFRGTAYHNTPMVNNCEQNPILRPKDLFRLFPKAPQSAEKGP